MNLILLVFFLHQVYVLIVEKSIGLEICYSIYQYAKANNKYMTDHDENKE